MNATATHPTAPNTVNTANTRRLWVIGSAAALGCLLLGLFLARPSAAVQDRTPAPPAVGRYQMTVGKGDFFYLLDTATGKAWWTSARGWEIEKGTVAPTWQPLIPPVAEQPKKK